MNREHEGTTAVLCFSDGAGGMELDTIKLARFLSPAHDIILICKTGSWIEQRCRKIDPPFPVVTLPMASRTFSLSLLRGMRRELKQRNIRNVVFFGASELKTLYFAFLGHEINLIVRHGTTKTRPKKDFLHRLIYSRVNWHVALSEHLLRNVRHIIPAGPHTHFVKIMPSLPVAPDREAPWRAAVKPGPAIDILHVGRITAGKGQVDALEACRGLCADQREFSLTLLGKKEPGDYSRRLDTLLADFPCAHRVHMPGHVDDVDAYLREADIFLFPSQGEGMPNAFIEALAQGCVCIAYANTVFPEFRELGFHVHLVPDQDVEALTRCLARVVKDLDEEKQRCLANRERVASLFQPARELEQWNRVLKT